MTAAHQDEQCFTYADYYSWDDDKRWELIDGVPYEMSAPGRIHQKFSGNLFAVLHNFLRGKTCEVYSAPFDVRLYGRGDRDTTVVQPDITVVCDNKKLDDKGCNGAPDMVVEILSESSTRHDTLIKFRAYQRAGVREYWVINPQTQTITVYLLESDKYVAYMYSNEDKVPVNVLDGCIVDASEVFY